MCVGGTGREKEGAKRPKKRKTNAPARIWGRSATVAVRASGFTVSALAPAAAAGDAGAARRLRRLSTRLFLRIELAAPWRRRRAPSAVMPFFTDFLRSLLDIVGDLGKGGCGEERGGGKEKACQTVVVGEKCNGGRCGRGGG